MVVHRVNFVFRNLIVVRSFCRHSVHFSHNGLQLENVAINVGLRDICNTYNVNMGYV